MKYLMTSFLLWFSGGILLAQSTIYYQDFENDEKDNWTYQSANFEISNDAGAYIGEHSKVYSNSARIKKGTASLQTKGEDAIAFFDEVDITTYRKVTMELSFAGVSLTTGNGIDEGDVFQVYLSDSDVFENPTLTVSGNETLLNIANSIQNDGSLVLSALEQTSVILSSTTPSLIQISIPDDWNTLNVKIVCLSNSSDEVWAIDEVVLKVEDKTCLPPTESTTELNIFNIKSNSAQLELNRGNGDGVLILQSQGEVLNVAPSCFYSYKEGDFIDKAYVVYSGAANGAGEYFSYVLDDLVCGETYYLYAYEYTEDFSYQLSPSKLSFTTQCQAPSPLKGISLNKNSNATTLSWEEANCADEILIIVKEGNGLNTFPEKQEYNANTVFGQGELIDDAYVVYAGTNQSGEVTVTSLETTESYFFYCFTGSNGLWSEPEVSVSSPEETWQVCEDFESNFKGSYADGTVAFEAGNWYFEQGGVFSLNTYDAVSGNRSVRLQHPASLELQSDLDGGILGKLKVKHAVFNNDESASWYLEISDDGGLTWAYKSNTIITQEDVLQDGEANDWEEQEFDINMEGNIRIRITTESGKRINFDDIEFTSIVLPSEVKVEDWNNSTIWGDMEMSTQVNIPLGSSLKIPLEVKNEGLGTLLINNEPAISVEGSVLTAWESTLSYPYNILPQENETFNLLITPQSVGEHNITVSWQTNDDDENTFTTSIVVDCFDSGVYNFEDSDLLTVESGDWDNINWLINNSGTWQFYKGGANENDPTSIFVQHDIVFTSDIIWNDTLNILDAEVDLDGYILDLGDIGVLSEVRKGETLGVLVDNSLNQEGELKLTNRKFDNTSLSDDIGGIGLFLQNGVTSEVTVDIVRYHQQEDPFDLPKFYKVTQIAGTLEDAVLGIENTTDELEQLPLNEQVLYRKVEGADWIEQDKSKVTYNENKVFYSGIDAFSYWRQGVSLDVLPVEWMNINLKKDEEGCNLLSWDVLGEKDCKGYEVQFSKDGKRFETIYWKSAINLDGFYSYNYKQCDNLVKGYYRLKQIDNNGTFQYSNLVETVGNHINVSLYPNPFSNILNLEVSYDGLVRMKILQIDGIQVYESVGYKTEINDILQNKAYSLKSGVYYIVLYMGNNIETIRIVKL